jgi:alpha-tubulin suppressor-like RCC1 family protein
MCPEVLKLSCDVRECKPLACGMGHTLALTGAGHVFTFGQGTFGALGHGDHANRDSPARVEVGPGLHGFPGYLKWRSTLFESEDSSK